MKCKECGARMPRDPRFDHERRFYTLKHGYLCPECGHVVLKHCWKETLEE